MGTFQPSPTRPDPGSGCGPARRSRRRLCLPGLLAAPAVLVACLVAPGPGTAQLSPLLVELRGGVTLMTEDFDVGGVGWKGSGDASPSFGADLTLVWAGRFAWYAGFGQDRFRCAGQECQSGEPELVTTGFDLGLRVLLFHTDRLAPWLGGGLLSYRAEEHRQDSRALLSDRDWGWEAGAGVYVVLGEHLYVNPSARYRSLNFDRVAPSWIRVSAVVVDVGLVLAF